MIFEILINVFVDFLLDLLDGINLISLPIDTVEMLTEYCIYGSYVVGSDLLLLFASTVFSWTSIKLLVGFGIRIWELLPLT